MNGRTNQRQRAMSILPGRGAGLGICLGCALLLAFDRRNSRADEPPLHTSTSRPTTQPAPADESFVKKLLGGNSTTGDIVEQTLDRLEQASRRLGDEHDPGDRTQVLQREIVAGIDQMIEEARRGSGGRSGSRDSRRPQRPPPGKRPTEGDARKGGEPVAGGQEKPSPTPRPATKESARRRTQKGELQRGWGYLPQRDRDQILQGFDEEHLSKYRAQIMEYYRRLATEAERSE